MPVHTFNTCTSKSRSASSRQMTLAIEFTLMFRQRHHSTNPNEGNNAMQSYASSTTTLFLRSSSFAKHRPKESSMASNSTQLRSSSHNQSKELCRYVQFSLPTNNFAIRSSLHADIFFPTFAALVINAFILTIDRRA